jgi:hypothetical protein
LPSFPKPAVATHLLLCLWLLRLWPAVPVAAAAVLLCLWPGLYQRDIVAFSSPGSVLLCLRLLLRATNAELVELRVYVPAIIQAKLTPVCNMSAFTLRP